MTDAAPQGRELTLTARLTTAALDARRGIVRLHPEVLAALGAAAPATRCALTGRRTTGAASPRGPRPAPSRALLYADDLMLGNLGMRDGGQVTVTPAPVVAARRVTLAGPPEIVAVVSPEMLRLALLGKVVTAGDDVSLLPQDVLPDAGRPLAGRGARGAAWPTGVGLRLDQHAAHRGRRSSRPDAALVTMDTVVGWQDGHVTGTRGDAAPAARPPAAPADRPGRAAAEHRRPARPAGPGRASCTELLDLGFHHREVLARLGTTVSLGVLVTGPAGSGKSALVRAVAASVGARVLPIWAPELAALTNDAAATRLRAAAREARGRAGPAVLLIADVEALAPRDEPGPLSTVFRQVLAETVTAPARRWSARPAGPSRSTRRCAARTCSTVQLAVPLPDPAMRREQLGVLTRGMPLAEDVRLDDVAGRTPGFVAADLRRAGPRGRRARGAAAEGRPSRRP